MFFYRRTIPGLAIHSYIVGNDKTKECAVIDPVRDVDEYISIAKENGLTITHILETHVHADFVSGAKELKHRLNGKPTIHSSGMGGDKWIPHYADKVVVDGDQVNLGDLTLQCVAAPGHTPEHVMWALYEGEEKGGRRQLKKLFTGDFLFVGAVGRPDLLGAAEVERLSHQLYHSVFNLLKKFSDDVEIRPAHGAGSLCGKSLGSDPYSTLGHERANNPSLKFLPEGEWIANLMHDMPPAPRYFARMKQVNVTGPSIIEGEISEIRPMLAEQVDTKMKNGKVLVIDFRSKEAFAATHIPGSINIPFGPLVSTWAGWMLPESQLILVLEEVNQLKEIVAQLLRIGFDDILGYLEGGIWAWETNGYPCESMKAISSAELAANVGQYYVLDVRSDGEWKAGHIDGAQHIHAGVIPDRLDSIPKDRELAVVCGSGYRASIVGSILLRNGFKDVTNVFGGMSAWPGKVRK